MSFTLITGASSGIGEALAVSFAKKKHDLILVARREKILKELAQEISSVHEVKVHFLACDITRSSEIEKLYGFINKNNLNVEILINNAGIGEFNLFENSGIEKIDYLIDLNIKAVTNITHFFIPGMAKSGRGKILNIASMAAFMPGPYIAVYAASKSFVLNFSIALNSELEHKNIQVSVLNPGDIKTEFQENANLSGYEIKREISLEQLAELTYTEFVDNKKTIIIPDETQKTLDNFLKMGDSKTISQNLYKLRKMLSRKLGL